MIVTMTFSRYERSTLSLDSIKGLLGSAKVELDRPLELPTVPLPRQSRSIPVICRRHWFLIVVSFKENLIYVLDSLPGNDQRTVIQSIVSTLLKYFEESRAGCEYGIDLSKYKFYVPLVKKTRKHVFFSFTKMFFGAAAYSLSWLNYFSYDCDFHVLLYIKGFDDEEKICNISEVILQI